MPIMAYTILLTPLWSSVTNAYTNKDFVWLKTTMKRLNMISLLVIAGIITMIFFSDFVFKIWLGKQQAADVKIPFTLTILMALYSIMNVFIAPYSYFVNGTGKLKLTMLFSIIGIALYFISIYLFGHKFTNSSGVLIAILIPYLLFTIVQPIQAYKVMNQKATGIFNQ
jgi:O-antigen/teichoic acid export membrane protein